MGFVKFNSESEELGVTRAVVELEPALAVVEACRSNNWKCRFIRDDVGEATSHVERASLADICALARVSAEVDDTAATLVASFRGGADSGI